MDFHEDRYPYYDSSDDQDDHYRYYRYRDEVFKQVYRCYSVTSVNKPSLENGDKIIMPPSALNRLASLNIEYPMLFELRNPTAQKFTHCGVLEFVAEEGCVYMPNWMMENMQLQEAQIVELRNTSLAKGTFMKLQPHTTEFFTISNPRAMLEMSLRSYSCLTTGDTIMIAYNNKKYYIDVVETKPSRAISIIETDCEVDFDQALDHKEPEKQPLSASPDRKTSTKVEEEPAPKSLEFIPFTGSAKRLDGKPSKQLVEQTPTPTLKKLKQTVTETKSSESKTSNSASCRTTQGKLVFGSNASAPKTPTPPKASLRNTSQDSSQKAEEPKFQAFTGKKYSLR